MSKAVYTDELRLLTDSAGAIKGLSGFSAALTGVGAGIAAFGLAAETTWDDARKTIVEGTGATGDALNDLLDDFGALSGSLQDVTTDQISAAIADLNTHLGLTGPALQEVASAALKAGVNTNDFGGIAKQMGLDVDGSKRLLDQLTAASQKTGVSVGDLTTRIGKNSARFQAAGASMEDLVAITIQAADEFGPAGLRGAMSEIAMEVDKGLIPEFTSLEDQLGDVSGAVDKTYDATLTWRGELGRLAQGLRTSLGPAMSTAATATGGVLTAAGGAAQAFVAMGGKAGIAAAATKGLTLVQRAFNLVLMANPIGLVITAIGIAATAWVLWGDKIKAFLQGTWNGFIDAINTMMPIVGKLGSLIGLDLPQDLDQFKFKLVEADTAIGDTGDSADATKAEFDELADSLGEGKSLLEFIRPAGLAAQEGLEEVTEETGELNQAAKDALPAIQLLKDATIGLSQSATNMSSDMLAEVKVLTSTALPEAVSEGLMELPDTVKQSSTMAGLTMAQNQAHPMMEEIGRIVSPDAISDLFTQAFTGGGGVLGALKALGAQLATAFAKHFLSPLSGFLASGFKSLLGKLFGGGGGGGGGIVGGVLQSAGSTAASAFMGGSSSVLASTNLGTLASGGAAGGAGFFGGIASGFKVVGGAIKSVLGAVGPIGWAALGVGAAFAFFRGWGGPSETEKKARAIYQAFSDGAKQELGGLESYASGVSQRIAAGQSTEIAHAKQAFVEYGRAAGVSFDEIYRLHDQFLDAIKREDVATMQRIMGSVEGWKQKWITAQNETETATKKTSAVIVATKEAEGHQVGAAITRMGHAAESVFSRMAAVSGSKIDTVGHQLRNIAQQAAHTASAANSHLNTIPRHITTQHTTYHNTVENIQRHVQNIISNIPAMAEGGIGEVRRPTLMLAGEAGPERFWFSGARNQVPPPGDSEKRSDDRPLIIQVPIDGEVVAEAYVRNKEKVADRIGLI